MSYKKMSEKLQAKIEEVDNLESINQALVAKERKSNDELQQARQYLMHNFSDMLSSPTTIGIKRMGELDLEAFQIACRRKFTTVNPDIIAAIYCSEWQEHLKDPNWHPFKVITEGENSQEVLEESDEKLVALKMELGDEAYEAAITALMELNDYNPSGRYVIQELWNFKEGQKASLKEVLQYILKQLKNAKKETRVTGMVTSKKRGRRMIKEGMGEETD